MFEDIHKIDSARFKPDAAKPNSDRDGKTNRRRRAGEKNPGSPVIQTDSADLPATEEENRQHPFLNIRV